MVGRLSCSPSLSGSPPILTLLILFLNHKLQAENLIQVIAIHIKSLCRTIPSATIGKQLPLIVSGLHNLIPLPFFPQHKTARQKVKQQGLQVKECGSGL